MKKVIRDGNVAVLISHGYGAGWYSWNSEHKQILFHPELVRMVEEGRNDEITDDWVMNNLGIKIYTGGKKGLCIEWIPEGTAFTVDEYDGAESLITSDVFNCIA